jgi:hypothetical protein
VGEGTLAVTPAPDVVEFRFVAEAFVDVPGHDHALLATALGPTLVVSGAGGRSAAERALEAQTRLNEAAAALRARPDLDFEIRDVQGAPKIALVREAGVLVEVTAEDAAAYNEDWTKTGGRGGPVTPARLAVWWEAVMRDLALALVRGEAPRHAAALSVEGRALSEVYRLSARAGAPGLPRLPAVLERAAVRDGMRTVALRVPATVVVRAAPPPPVPGAAPSPVPEASPPAARVAFQLDGLWSGSEVERGVRRYVSLQARGRTGSYTYEGGLSLSVPLLSLEQPQRGVVHFSLRMRGSPRYYEGRWDGARITGRISSAPGGSGDLGTFELAPLR